MAVVNSRLAKLSINGADLSAYVDTVDGLPPDMATDDVTTFGVTGRKHAATLTDGTFTFGGPFDDTATTGPDAVLAPLQAAGTSVAFVYGPAGSATGARRVTGNCIVTQYKPSSKVGSVVRFTATAQINGSVTVDVY
jgi:hypothetical protein